MSRQTTSSNDGIFAEDPFASERSWISRHCMRRGFDLYCRVPSEFIQDHFNLTGLDELVTNYDAALFVILDGKYRQTPGDRMNRFAQTADVVERSANKLYGLIHARYAMSAEGIADVRLKYLNREFGVCPRVFCKNANVIPIGLSDTVEVASVKAFCPQCNDVYEPKSSSKYQLDGAFFGTGLPHMLFMMHPELRPLPLSTNFDARLFGFKLYNFESRKHISENTL